MTLCHVHVCECEVFSSLARVVCFSVYEPTETQRALNWTAILAQF